MSKKEKKGKGSEQRKKSDKFTLTETSTDDLRTIMGFQTTDKKSEKSNKKDD